MNARKLSVYTYRGINVFWATIINEENTMRTLILTALLLPSLSMAITAGEFAEDCQPYGSEYEEGVCHGASIAVAHTTTFHLSLSNDCNIAAPSPLEFMGAVTAGVGFYAIDPTSKMAVNPNDDLSHVALRWYAPRSACKDSSWEAA
jgi:hypothetical protein